MIKKLQQIWTEWTDREKWLLGLLILSLAGGAWVFSAWMQDLRPWATEYGTVADWWIFAATAAGFGVAVYTLRKNARDETNRRERSQRMEAARVTATLNRLMSDVGIDPGDRAFRLSIRNGGSSPVTELEGCVDYTHIPGPYKKIPGESTVYRFSVGLIASGACQDMDFEVSGKAEPEFTAALSRAVCFWFRDAEGDFWMYEQGKLKKVPPNREDQMLTAMSEQI